VVARVTRTGGFLVHGVFYSAPSQLVGKRLRVHVYDDRIEAFLGTSRVVTHPRHRARRDGARVHCVNDRASPEANLRFDVIHALRRKPQALAGSVYRDGLFPRTEYAEAWTALSAGLPRKEACRRMVDLLWLAHDEGCEAELATLIALSLEQGQLPKAGILKQHLAPRQRTLPNDAPVELTDLASFDALPEGHA